MQVFMKDKSLENSRMAILWLTNMIDTRTTMKGIYRHGYNCPHCEEGVSKGTLESPGHLLQCEAYVDLRQGINPECIPCDRAVYLRKVITRRKELEAKLVLASTS